MWSSGVNESDSPFKTLGYHHSNYIITKHYTNGDDDHIIPPPPKKNRQFLGQLENIFSLVLNRFLLRHCTQTVSKF